MIRHIFGVLIAIATIIGIIFGIGYLWYLAKSVQVWSAQMDGEAVLAEAKYSRQVRVQEAEAKKAAAELEGQAELIRANYSAQANKALTDGLGGPEGYLRYLYIRMLEEQKGDSKQIIYIPTEAGMPILEAGKR